MQTGTNNPSGPTTLVVHGANFLGQKLIELLSAQKSNIVLVDEFSRKNSEIIKTLKKDFGVQSYDLSGIQSFEKNFKRIDYVFILLDQFILSNNKLSSKRFLSETNIVDTTLKLALKHSAKVIVTTTLLLHRKLTSNFQALSTNLSEISEQEPYNPMELQRYCENLSAEYHDQAGLDIRIARLGEVIGEGMALDGNTLLVNMIKESITKPRITIMGEGLDYAYYVHVLDAVYGLVKAIFSSKTTGEVYSLSYPEEISTLNLAYKILELNPKATEIEFTEGSSESGSSQIYVPAKNLAKLGWVPKIPFEQAVMETLQYFYNQYHIKWANKPLDHDEQLSRIKTIEEVRPVHASDQVTPAGSFIASISIPIKRFFTGIRERIAKTSGSVKSFKLTPAKAFKISLTTLVSLVLFFFLIGPIIQILAGGGLTYYFAQKGYKETTSMDTTAATKSFETANYFAEVLDDGVNGFLWVKYITAAEPYYENAANLSSGVRHLTAGASYLVQGISPYVAYFNNFEPITSFDENALGGSRGYETELSAMEDSGGFIDKASIEFSLASSALNSSDFSIFPTFIENKAEEITSTTTTINETVTNLRNFSDFFPELLGKTERKTYVILLQNPMELRSTGGWLTSYGIIGIEQGQVRQLVVDDVYNADGQLQVVVKPPETMSTALGISEWNLALSNWSPSFPESAEAAEYFLKLEDKVVTVDGVIAIDLEYIKNLVDVWGEITVPEEDQPVTKDNLFEKIVEIHSEFTPGSRDKPEFLSSLANEIIKLLLQDSRDKLPQISEITSNALSQKHIQIYIHNSSVSQLLQSKNWSGTFTSSPDFVYPVEWNAGGNKANYFTERSSTLEVKIIDENTIEQKLMVTYRNNGTENVYPQGDYKNYFRLYLPSDARVIRQEGIESYVEYEDSGLSSRIVSGWANVPIQQSKTISVTYRLTRGTADFPLSIGAGNTATFSMDYIKQAGLISDPLTVSITYPQAWLPQSIVGFHAEENVLTQQLELDTDKNFTLTWQK